MTKKAMNVHVRRHKEILVSKGFQQIHGIDYDENFSPIVNLDSIRLALAIGEERGWKVLSPFLCFHKPYFCLFICHFSFILSHISHKIAYPRYICHPLTSELNFLNYCIKIGNLAEITGFDKIP
jgi:hypothetical protein